MSAAQRVLRRDGAGWLTVTSITRVCSIVDACCSGSGVDAILLVLRCFNQLFGTGGD
jgi:hypothetical protein